uniref:asparagine--tRNA ligase n=1 Tax=Dermatophagoides pteronyssinus TaxID=6956 RepID=A0A6P6YDS0_DERPT|nr:uncharacterized protein LOC113796765 [Dermatophagoides pteronyssinus]
MTKTSQTGALASKIEYKKLTTTAANATRISALCDLTISSNFVDQIVTVNGWVQSARKQGQGLVFVNLNDGTTPKNLQIVIDTSDLSEELAKDVKKLTFSSSISVTGLVKKHMRYEGLVEMFVNGDSKYRIIIYNIISSSCYPLQKNVISDEKLRSFQHLRPRVKKFQSVMRIRDRLSHATHQFFSQRGFYYIHTPLITGADCEGAGEMFQVTTLLPESGEISKIPQTKDQKIDYSKDFFSKPVSLTVSGQIALENFCLSMGDVYTFGPTFRAEISHTSRHLAEFWMIEPEMAFVELDGLIEVASAYLKFCVNEVIQHCHDDIQLLEENGSENLAAFLNQTAQEDFVRLSYTEAIQILKAIENPNFKVSPEWGDDLGSEHERYLTEVHFKKPVIVYNYPYKLKAFYMKLNQGEQKGKETVRAMDILVPGIGEIIGGSQREETIEQLTKQCNDKNLPIEPLQWYFDLRRYGSIPHSGFGLGFERLIMLCTGIRNIRDVIPFPRYVGHAEH